MKAGTTLSLLLSVLKTLTSKHSEHSLVAAYEQRGVIYKKQVLTNSMMKDCSSSSSCCS
jgi:hypothetical protein